jgi:hypothetical protein
MKRICIIALALLTLLMSVSCGGTPQTKEPDRMVGLPDVVRNARKNAPADTLIGIGMAKLASQSQSKAVAETRARAEISRAMETMVQDMVRDYQASSELEPASALSFQENITVALSKSTLQGAVIQDEDYVDGTYYVVIYLNKTNVVREINQAQAAAKLAVPAMASFNAEARMNEAFDRENSRDLRIGDR